MSLPGEGEAEQQQQKRDPVTETHKKLVFSFIRTIANLDIDRRDSTAAVSALSRAFNVDPAGVDGVHDAKVNLVEVFESAVVKSAEIDPRDEKFIAFLELLTKKGYFQGAPEGSEEYKARLKKAEAKFRAKSNPYEGLNAEQLKERGNELVQKGSYRDAVGFYTKAIELNPESHIYYANRAAAFTHLKDFSSAINDGEKSVALNPKYAKAFSRLGTAYFFEGNYQRATDSYSRALELDPENSNYKQDFDRAKEKLASSGGAGKAGNSFPAFPGMGQGMPGMPGGGMDFGNMMQMMNTPAFQQMAQNMMQNPNFMQTMGSFAQQMGMQAPNEDSMNQFLKGGKPEVDEEGNFQTPFGSMNRDKIEQMRQEHQNDPKLRAIMEDVQQNGFGAFTKYMNDPEVMGKIQEMMGAISANAPSGGGGSQPQVKPPQE